MPKNRMNFIIGGIILLPLILDQVFQERDVNGSDIPEYRRGRCLIINMRGFIAGIQKLEPSILVIQNTIRKRLLHHRLRAVDFCVSLIQQILPQGFPGQLRAELEPLDNTIPNGVQAKFVVVGNGLIQR